MVPEKSGEKVEKEVKAEAAVKAKGELEAAAKSAQKKAQAEKDSPGKPEQSAKSAAGLLKKEREFVIPGDKIVDTMDYLPGRNCFRSGDSVYAKKIGLVSISGRVVSVIPLNEAYIAKMGDMIIGEITEIQSNGWVVEIYSPVEGYMPLSGVREFIDTTKTNLSRYYDIGDVIYAKITHANYNSVHLSMDDTRARKFRTGRIVNINPAKVPRLIGKQGSMISLIKGKTGCRISVGQNGLVWLEGENEELAIKVINVVEHESYTEGLTDRVSALLKKEIGKKKPESADAAKTAAAESKPKEETKK